MSETRKIAAILAADVVGFSRMASADEDRTLARLRALRADLLDPTVASQNGRVFKRTGDGALVEFRSVVEAVRCATTIQNAMMLGKLDEARSEVKAGLALDPTFTLRRFRLGTASDNAVFLKQRERAYDGMRKAGVPEG